MSERNEGTSKQYRVEDMSGTGASAGPPSTRGRVASENPAVKSPLSEEQYRASQEAAKRAAIEAKERMRQAYQEAPSEQPTYSSLPEPELQLEPEYKVPVEPKQLQADLRQLAYAGRIEEEFEVAGFLFVMCTLTSKENNDAAAALSKVSSNELQRVGLLRHAILARSIKSVNGAPLEALYSGPDSKLSILEKREAVIGEWQQLLVTELMMHYDDLLERSQKVFKKHTDEQLKNS